MSVKFRRNLNYALTVNYRSFHYLRSRLFIPSSIRIEKEAKNKDKTLTKSNSNLILEKNGFISNSGHGLITFLPLGKRILNKLTTIIREEMNKIGGQEISMPSLSNLNLWKKTNRDELIGAELFKLTDRKERQLCLCPTHEEVVTNLVSQFSKLLNKTCLGEQQALLLYQITSKFRDEPQTKHCLLRACEFLMKDMYTFHLSEKCAQDTYENVCKAYEAVFTRLDLNYIKAKASVGAMGGSMSHEYQIESQIGEDVIYQCSSCGKAISNDLIGENDKDKKINSICNLVECENTKEAVVGKKSCIEIGHTFILGDRYTKVFPIKTESSDKVLMGCYGIGVSRLIQACIENNQQNDLYPIWPLEITPFQIVIIPPKVGSKEESLSDQILNKLLTQFCNDYEFKDEVLVDDRNTNSIGSRVIDAKLVGASYILVLGKLLHENKLEIIINSTSIKNVIKKDNIICSIDDALKTIKDLNLNYFKTRSL